MNYIVLIPAYNPCEKMVSFLKILKKSNIDVIIVNDGSKAECEKYFDFARSLGYHVLAHSENRGKGCALKTGFSYIIETKSDVDYVITADCDGQYDIESIQTVAKAGEESGNESIILGLRFCDKNLKHHVKANMGTAFTRVAFRLATGLKVRDTRTGLRAIPQSLFRKMCRLKGERYEYDMNMLLKLNDWGVPFKEVPVKSAYNNNTSYYAPFKDSIRILSQILIFSLSSFVSFAMDYGLFILVNHLLFNITGYHVPIAYFVGRVISSVFNYTVNSRLVFKEFSLKSILKYTLLCLFIMGLGAIGSYLMEDLAGIPGVICKLVVDFPLFFISYFGQKKFVFTKKGKKK